MARESIGDLVRVIITFAVGKYFIEAVEQMFHGFI